MFSLHALEFWIRHLHSCVGECYDIQKGQTACVCTWFLIFLHTSLFSFFPQDIVEDYYHQWGFLSLAQRPKYGPLFQELLLLLQPLSSLPFDFDVPTETHIQNKKQDQAAALPHGLLEHSSQILQMSSIQRTKSDVSSNEVTSGYWLDQTPTSERESTVFYSDRTHKKEDNEKRMGNNEITGSSPASQDDKSLSPLRWARLFGSVGGSTTKAQKNISGSMRLVCK